MTSTLAVLAFLVLAYAAWHRRLDRVQVSAAMFFTAAGLALGPGLGVLDLQVHSETVKLLAEVTLVLVLFTDASRISVGSLRSELSVPGRLLGIGLPLTIGAGLLVALLLQPSLTVLEALLLAVMLSCTDAALGKAVVTDRRVPSRIRQGLNVESGLNDGLCVPIFLVALSAVEAEEGVLGHGQALRILAEQLGLGAVAGVVAGVLGVLALRTARPQPGSPWGQVLTVAVAALSAGLANAWEGSIFIAAFTAGLVTAALPVAGTTVDEHTHLLEEAGELCNGIAFVLLGAVILAPAVQAATWTTLAYALLSLTVVRMVPVAVALLGTGASRPTVAYVGWFGPRGLASVVFGVMLVDDADLLHENAIIATVALTVGLSVVLHGLTATPFTNRYVQTLPVAPRPGPEEDDVRVPRWRLDREPAPDAPASPTSPAPPGPGQI